MKRWIKEFSRNKLYSRLYSIIHDIETIKDVREVNLLGRKFIQYPDVFPVDKFADTEFFSKAIKVQRNEYFLEIGVGSGVTSVLAAINGANVIGVDINESAVANSKMNASINKVENRTEFFLSDVFSRIPFRTFDTIYWNVPFCYSEIEDLNLLEKSVFDFHYESLEKFIKNSKSYLNPEGRLLIGFSNVWGLWEKLLKLLIEAGYKNINIVAQKNVQWYSIDFDLTLYEIKNN